MLKSTNIIEYDLPLVHLFFSTERSKHDEKNIAVLYVG